MLRLLRLPRWPFLWTVLWLLPFSLAADGPTVAAQGVNLSGRWTSNLGAVSLRQSGSSVSGTLIYPNGVVAQLNGVVQGNTLSCRFFIAPGIGGTCTLAIGEGGKSLSGRYTGTQGKSGVFNLTRNTPAPAQPRQRAAPTRANLPVEDILRQLFPPQQPGGTEAVQPDAVAPPPRRRIPSTEKLARLPVDQLRKYLKRSIDELTGQLQRLENGSSWSRYLETEELRRIITATTSDLPSDEDRELLKAIAEKFKSTRDDPKYRRVSDLLGFKAVRAGLGPLSVEPVAYARRQLAPNVADLQRSLDALGRDKGWHKHLQTDELARIVRETYKEDDDKTNEVLREIAKRYDAVKNDPQYTMIASLSGFDATRQKVLELLAALARRQEKIEGIVRSGVRRQRIVEVLEGLIAADDKKTHAALQTKVLKEIVGRRRGKLSPSEVDVLKAIHDRMAKMEKSAEATEVMQLPAYKETSSMVSRFVADVDQLNVSRAQLGMLLLTPGSRKWQAAPDSKSAMGVVQLKVPEEVVLMPLEPDVEPVDVMLMPLETEPEAEPPMLLQFSDVDKEPDVPMLLQFSDEEEKQDKTKSKMASGYAISTTQLNRWNDLTPVPRIDRVEPASDSGYQPGDTISLVGRYFSAQREQNTVQILKRLVDGSVGALADLTPSVASTSGTALEVILPKNLAKGQLVVRVLVAGEGGKVLTSNPVELSVGVEPAEPPVITRIDPSSAASFQMITVDGRNFGDAALVELWFHPNNGQTLPTSGDKQGAPVRTSWAQVLSDTQLYARVPLNLAAGKYVVAALRGGRLSNWHGFRVTEAPAKLQVAAVEAQQLWAYADPKKALTGNVQEEARRLKDYWYRVRV